MYCEIEVNSFFIIFFILWQKLASILNKVYKNIIKKKNDLTKNKWSKINPAIFTWWNNLMCLNRPSTNHLISDAYCAQIWKILSHFSKIQSNWQALHNFLKQRHTGGFYQSSWKQSRVYNALGWVVLMKNESLDFPKFVIKGFVRGT